MSTVLPSATALRPRAHVPTLRPPLRRARHPVAALGVLGAGHGGTAVAGLLALRGLPVILYNRGPARISELRAAGRLTLETPEGTAIARPAGLTSDLRRVAEAPVLLIAVPASAHRDLAGALAPLLRSGQTVVLHPGRTLGAVEFLHVLRGAGCRAEVTVAETDTLLCAARCAGDRVHVFGVKRRVRLAALPGGEAAAGIIGGLAGFLPELVPAASVLETGLSNLGAILHPAPVLCNLARIDAGCPFDYYREGITPAVGRLLERLDGERLAVAAAYGAEVVPAGEWLAEAYGATGPGLWEAVQSNPAYRGIPSPPRVECRYLREEVPTGLVPLAWLAGLAGVPAPTANALIDLADAVCATDFRTEGRSPERMGLRGWSARRIRLWLQGGASR